MVSHLISGHRDQAVLPKGGELQVNQHEGRLYSARDKARQSLIQSAELACFPPGPDPEQNRQCRKQAMPSYINYSMTLTSHRKHYLSVIHQLKKFKQSLRTNTHPKTEQEYKEEYDLLWYDYKKDILGVDIDIADLFTPLHQKIEKDIARFEKKLNNYSIDTDPSYSAFESLAQNGSLIVMATGNHNPQPINELKTTLSRESGVVLVGSLEPDGRPSSFSQKGEEVAIMAPSGFYIHSADQNEKPHLFSGTSGATPLVTGALAGFEWLSGHRPEPSQAKILLEKTAIPLLSSNDNPRENGAGLLNAYKLGMVGARLKKICGQDPNCFRKEIQKPKTYQFPEDEGLDAAIEETFPDCSLACGGTKSHSCEKQAEVFQRLRRAALLNPHNRKHHIRLACIYKMQGFEEASLHHLNSVKALGGSNSQKEVKPHCQTDNDCVLVKSCDRMSRISPLKAMIREQADIHHTLHCRKTLCNGKCDCSNKEQLGPTVYFSRCVRSQCSLQTESAGAGDLSSPLPQEDSSQKQDFSPAEGQR